MSSVRYHVCGWLAFVCWGINTLYWHLLVEVPLSELVVHRFFWTALFIWAYALLSGYGKTLSEISRAGARVLLIPLAMLVLSVNWFTFNYAIISEQILQASLGYYIAPLMFVCLSVCFLKEPVSALKRWSIVLAVCGVLFLTFLYGAIPWISLLLAFSFSVYGFLKRFIPLNGVMVLALEFLCVFPFACYAIVTNLASPQTVFMHHGFGVSTLLMLGGVVTVIPLILFNVAVKHVPFATIGFMQYVTPTFSLLIALVLGERFSYYELFGFLFIWGAVILYFVSETKIFKKIDRSLRSAP